MNDDGKQIKRISSGGSILSGEAIMFVVEFEDGTTEPFHLRYENVAQFVTTLRTFTQMAQEARRSRPAAMNLDEVIQPYHVAAKPRTGVSPDGTIAVRFPTTEGIPVELAIPRDLARSLAEWLQTTLARSPSGSGRH